MFPDVLLYKVIPVLRSWPHENSVVVINNASIHHHPTVRRLVEAQGASLMFMPAYSFDCNPIEHAFSKVKAYLQRERHLAERDPTLVIAASLRSITSDDAAGYFEDCGYPVLRLAPGVYL